MTFGQSDDVERDAELAGLRDVIPRFIPFSPEAGFGIARLVHEKVEKRVLELRVVRVVFRFMVDDKPDQVGNSFVKLAAMVNAVTPEIRDEQAVEMGGQFIRGIDPIQEMTRVPGRPALVVQRGDLIERRIQLEEPFGVSFSPTAIGFRLFVWSVQA